MLAAEGFPQRLAASLKSAGMTAVDVARAAGMSHPSIGRYLAGDTHPSILLVERIALALAVDPRWLAYG